MMLAAVPVPVDPINDWVDYWNLALAGAGGMAAVVAIVIALRADRKADRTVADERQRVFELEVLRDLLKELEETGIVEEVYEYPNALQKYRFRLALLSSKLDYWEYVLTLGTWDRKELLRPLGLSDDYVHLVEQNLNMERQAKQLKSELDEWRQMLANWKDSYAHRTSWPPTGDSELRWRTVIPDYDAFVAGPSGWQQTIEQLELRVAQQEFEWQPVRVKYLDFPKKAQKRIAERLARDLQQMIESRVLTGKTYETVMVVQGLVGNSFASSSKKIRDTLNSADP